MSRPMFHQENNRLNYGELLMPELGFTLDFAVGLTYSLDLEALLGVPVSLGMLDEIDSSHIDNPFFLLEAIRKSSDKIAIFCNAGAIKMPQRIEPVFALLEQSVFEVKLIKGANFHPKLWLIRYNNMEGEAYIKVIVLSRNLTFDRSFDVAIELSGNIGSTKRKGNRPLADLLHFVAPFANEQKKKKIQSLAREIMKVKSFTLGEQFESCSFHPFGISGYKKQTKDLLSDAHELIVISPFLSDGVVKMLTERPWKKTLITRKNSVTQKVMDSFDDVYIAKDVVLGNELLEEANPRIEANRDIHAKIYFKSSGNGNYLYLGSLNASANAFYHNVEFMIGLKFKPHYASYASMLKDFLPEDGCPFERLEAVDPEAVPDNEEECRSLLDVIYALQAAVACPAGKRYNVKITASPLEAPAMIAPIYRPRAFVPIEEDAILSNLLLKELSDFYIIRRGKDYAVVKLHTEGIPTDDRDNAIYNSIIKNKNAFLAYVTFMLADNFTEVSMEQRHFLDAMRRGDDLAAIGIPSALYERMLRAVTEHPGKIGDIEDVMKRLDSSVVTEDFKELLATFKAVAKKVKKR